MTKLKWFAVHSNVFILSPNWFGKGLNMFGNYESESFVEKIISEVDEFIMLVLLVLIFCFLVFLNFKRINHKQRLQYESIIANQKLEYTQVYENSKDEINAKDGSSRQKVIITNDTVSALLVKLSEFEKSQMYIDQNMSLSTLSSLLNTNTKYLSEIIKHHKNKKFKNYINGLRIEYIIELLFNNPEYREYKISYLAGCCGFSSRVVFGVVFKKEKGISPSYFIQSLGKREKSIATSLI